MLFASVLQSASSPPSSRLAISRGSRAAAWLVVAAPAPPKPTKTREFAARQETAAKTLKVLNSLGLRASRAMATVVESEEVKTDEEKAVKKVAEEENEPESAGAPVAARGPGVRRGEGGLPASLFGRRDRLRVLSHAAHISDES